MRNLDAGLLTGGARDLWRERVNRQNFMSICVVDNLARWLDRRRSVVMIGWNRVGKDLDTGRLSNQCLLHEFD